MAETALDPLVGTSGTGQELITQKLAEGAAARPVLPSQVSFAPYPGQGLSLCPV